jgi:hypothetical protein
VDPVEVAAATAVALVTATVVAFVVGVALARWR